MADRRRPRPRAALIGAGQGGVAVADVDAGRIAAVTPAGRVRVLGNRGRLLAESPPFARGAERVALDGWRVAAARAGILSVDDARSDELLVRRRLAAVAGPPRLEDIDRGLVAYASGLELHLLRLADGRDRIVDLPEVAGHSAAQFIAGGDLYVSARFADRGLYVAYSPRPGRILLFPLSALR